MSSKATEKDYWNNTRDLLGSYEVTLNSAAGFLESPVSLTRLLSRCKFAAKMACWHRTVLQLGCEQGIGAAILGEMAQSYLGVDSCETSIQTAVKNHPYPKYSFIQDVCLGKQYGKFETVVSFDQLSRLEASRLQAFIDTMMLNLAQNGLCVIGDAAACKQIALGLLLERFYHVFPFNVTEEAVHCNASGADWLFLCCHRK